MAPAEHPRKVTSFHHGRLHCLHRPDGYRDAIAVDRRRSAHDDDPNHPFERDGLERAGGTEPHVDVVKPSIDRGVEGVEVRGTELGCPAGAIGHDLQQARPSVTMAATAAELLAEGR
jgi:hypothetical protein